MADDQLIQTFTVGDRMVHVVTAPRPDDARIEMIPCGDLSDVWQMVVVPEGWYNSLFGQPGAVEQLFAGLRIILHHYYLVERDTKGELDGNR